MSLRTKWSLFMLAIGLLGLAVLSVGLGQAMGGSGSSDWPTTTGVITESLVETLTDLEGEITYAPGVAYSYEAEGMIFPYNRLNYQPSADRSQAEEVVARYPLGAAVTVYYDPADPGQSTLEPGWAGSTWVLIVVGAGVAVTGLAGVANVRTSKNEVSGVLMRRSSFRRYGGGLNWQPCPGPELAPGEEVLWRGRPVKGAFLLSSSRQSSLQGVPVMVLGLVLLLFGLPTGSGLAVVGGVFLAIPLLFMVLSIRTNLRDYPMVEHLLTDRRALTRQGMGGAWYCVPLSGVTQVLMAQNLADRLFHSCSLVFTDTAVVDFYNIRESERVRGLMVEAMRDIRST